MNLYVFLFCLMFFRGVVSDNDDENEAVTRYRNLVNSIFTDSYSTDIRPSKDFLKPTNVTLRIRLSRIVDLDIENQVLVFDALVFMSWIDEFLQWSMETYKYSYIQVKLYDIWTPILMHVTSAEQDYFAANFGRGRAYVKYNGRVYARNVIRFKVRCPLDLTNYPFDTQNCVMILMDRLHSTSSVNYTRISIDEDWWAEEHAEYDVVGTKSKATDSLFSFVIKLRRLSIGHFYFVILPYFTSVLFGIAVFLAPVGSNQRLWYGGITLYILNELLYQTSSTIGFNSLGIPYIVKCLGLNTIFVGISLTLTTFIYQIMMNFSHSCPRLPNVLIDFLNNRLIMIMFGIDGPQPRKQIELENGKDIEETDEISKDLVDTKVKTIEEWMQMIQFTDRILFILYIITVIVYHA